MKPDLKLALRTIAQYTYDVFGHNTCKIIFDGSMSIADFAEFVYFEYCALRFINTEKTKPVDQFLSELQDVHLRDYTKEIKAMPRNDDENEGNNQIQDNIPIDIFSFSWLHSKNYRSFSRSVTRYVDSMLKAREVPIPNPTKNFSGNNALYAIKEYNNSSPKNHRTGIPIGRTFFYQALCECAFKVKGIKKYEQLANVQTNTDDINVFYSNFDHFVKNFMLSDYSTDFSENDQNIYIAKAINLVKLADRRKFDLIYVFAQAIDKIIPDYWDKTTPKDINNPSIYRFSNLPPLFFDTVTKWLPDHNSPDPDLESIFYTLSNSIFCKADTISFASPVMCFDKYMANFISGSNTIRKNEEYRYYIIKLAAEVIKNMLSQENIQLEYSERNFAFFIHNHYNIFDKYRAMQKERSEMILSKKVAHQIREISRQLYP